MSEFIRFLSNCCVVDVCLLNDKKYGAVAERLKAVALISNEAQQPGGREFNSRPGPSSVGFSSEREIYDFPMQTAFKS